MDQPTDKKPADKAPELDLNKISDILSRASQDLSKPADTRPGAPADPAKVPAEAAKPAAPVEPAQPELDDRTKRALSILEGFKTGRDPGKLEIEIKNAFKAEPTEQAQNELAKYLNDRAPAGVSFTPHRAPQNAQNMEVLVTKLMRNPYNIPLGHPFGEAYRPSNEQPRVIPGLRPATPAYPINPGTPGVRPEVPAYPVNPGTLAPRTPELFQMPKLPVPGSAEVPPPLKWNDRAPSTLPMREAPVVRPDMPIVRPAAPGAPTDAVNPALEQKVKAISDAIALKKDLATDDIKRTFQSVGTEAGQKELAAALTKAIPGMQFSVGRPARNITELTITGLPSRRDNGRPFVMSLGHPRDEPYGR